MMDLVSVRQASRELHVAERTIHHAVRSGELPAYRLGQRTVRVDRGDLKQWVQGKRVDTWRPSEK